MDKDVPATPPPSHCPHCDAPVDADGFHHPPEDMGHDAADAVLRLAQTVVDNPRSGLIVCMAVCGIRQTEAAKLYAELIGKACSRQLLYDARLRAAKVLPGIEPLIFDRISHSESKRAVHRTQRGKRRTVGAFYPPPK
jgi:hypothetical protein